ncbi:hypothetical protein HDV06_005515 [Boothiomyces sp. JEL0866]|nr:hypothetical protein HDV06_005515 [Boothiomyces sp. JEL0866]
MSYRQSQRDTRSPSQNKWAAAAQAAEKGGETAWQEEDRMNNMEYLQQETRRVQGESVNSTRRALRRLNDAQTVGEQNLVMLNGQSEQFNRMERRLDEANANAKSVDAKVDHLTSLNKWFFLPSFGAKKAAKKEEELRQQKEAEQFKSKFAKERDQEWNSRSERQARQQEQFGRSNGPRSYYTTPDGLERDAQEEEIDSNLNQISSGLSRLKMMGMAMNDEMDSQDKQLRRLQQSTDNAQTKVNRLNNKMENLKDRRR